MLTVSLVPGRITPPGEEAFNQVEVMDRPHVKVLVPTLVNVSIVELGRNGPPSGPEEINPVLALSRKSSGQSNASTTPVVVELDGALALNPMPRFAKALHNSF